MSPLPDKLYSPGQVICCVILHWKNLFKKETKTGKKLIPDAKKMQIRAEKKAAQNAG